MRVTRCLANSVSGIIEGSASHSFRCTTLIQDDLLFDSNRSEDVGRLVFILEGHPSGLAVPYDIQLLCRDHLDNNGMRFLVGSQPSFSLLPSSCDNGFIAQDGNHDTGSIGVKALDLLARSEFRDYRRVVVGAVDKFQVAGSVVIYRAGVDLKRKGRRTGGSGMLER
ncbi:hypothetical protein DFH07DRAFT_727429 [Mycena maculata]|uniref:Uncharacterized protein n=1 Tax=Mycena maculata TaxID=230809 RepID=A0AAD7KIF4_9AGAR|nr:hypothetical protein DFH07DRAFT_727429 [Mycena maculata]